MDVSPVLPQDLVAVFHASFHPTKGNTLDWSLTLDQNIPLHDIEFTVLPSGLHLVDQDVIYFSKHGYSGICIYNRRSSSQAARGFTMSSLGVLVAKSKRPRPWRHKDALKQLISDIYSNRDISNASTSARDVNSPPLLELSLDRQADEINWDPVHAYFEKHKVVQPNIGGEAEWNGWSDELDMTSSPHFSLNMPTLHLSHMLAVLGPSSLTLYKHAIGRRRILFFTAPPVEPACIFSHTLADLCLDYQVNNNGFSSTGANTSSSSAATTKKGTKEAINVLGMITLHDIDTLRQTSTTRGWIACTTDALFLEKPECYDLLVDLTTFNPIRGTRPNLFLSQPAPSSSGRPKYKLSPIRFVWSDIRLWNELDRILKRDATDINNTGAVDDRLSCTCASSSPINASYPAKPFGSSRTIGSTHINMGGLTAVWTDVWRLYEDVCLICAGLLFGNTIRNSCPYSGANEELQQNERQGGGWGIGNASGGGGTGGVRLEGDDDLVLSTSIRKIGLGIEGQPNTSNRYGLNRDGDDNNLAGSMSPVGGMKATAPMTVVRAASTSSTSASATTETRHERLQGRSVYTSADDMRRRNDPAGSTSPSSRINVNTDMDATFSDQAHVVRDRQILTTLALLQTFHAHTCFQLSQLERLISRSTTSSSSTSSSSSSSSSSPSLTSSSPAAAAATIPLSATTNPHDAVDQYAFGDAASVTSAPVSSMSTVILTARDVLSFELGPLCSLDAKYLAWLAEEYAPGRKLIVKTTWRDLVGILFGY